MKRETTLTFLADKVNLECASFVLAHLLVPVPLAEDIELDILEPDAVLRPLAEPGRRLRLMGD